VNKIKLSQKIIQEFTKSKILSIGTGHGIKEIYEVVEDIISQLPIKPNIAIELDLSSKIEYEKFFQGLKVDISKIYFDFLRDGVLTGDGRVTKECFNFLKKYQEQNPSSEIIFLDEENKNPETIDLDQANQFLKNFHNPTIIIAGNLHSSKEIKEYSGNKIIPMGFYIKEKVGDFPYINIQPASGSYFNGKIVEIKEDVNKNIGELLDLGNSNYLYIFAKATPTTQFEP
jgi:hypothetical protein